MRHAFFEFFFLSLLATYVPVFTLHFFRYPAVSRHVVFSPRLPTSSAVYKVYGVKDDIDTNVKLQPGDLTPSRLRTFFRVQIHKSLEVNENVLPYLWKRYSTLDVRYRSITFPGAESLVETREEGLYLLETYKSLERFAVNISERIKRILVARRVIEEADLSG